MISALACARATTTHLSGKLPWATVRQIISVPACSYGAVSCQRPSQIEHRDVVVNGAAR